MRTLEYEVGTAETCLVRGVHNYAEIADESGCVLLSGQVRVDVAVERRALVTEAFQGVETEDLLRSKAGPGHVSVLARQIANLALVWLTEITRRNFSGAVRVQVRAG